MEAAGQYSALLQYALHPSSLQQLQMLEPADSWAGASAPMLRACAAVLAALRQDAVQDATIAHAHEAAQPSILQTSFLRHGNTAVSNPLIIARNVKMMEQYTDFCDSVARLVMGHCMAPGKHVS